MLSLFEHNIPSMQVGKYLIFIEISKHNFHGHLVLIFYIMQEDTHVLDIHLISFIFVSGPTIEECLKLAREEPSRFPSPLTVANMIIQRLCLVKEQLKKNCLKR